MLVDIVIVFDIDTKVGEDYNRIIETRNDRRIRIMHRNTEV